MHSGLNESMDDRLLSDKCPELETRSTGVDDIGKGTIGMDFEGNDEDALTDV